MSDMRSSFTLRQPVFVPVILAAAALLGSLAPAAPVSAQSRTDLQILRALAPVSVLSKTDMGRAALGANLTVTGAIQNGEWPQSSLVPFAEQQQLALRDVFITAANVSQLADGLGTTLGGAYIARAHYITRNTFTSVSQNVTDVIAYAIQAARSGSNSGKYFFANKTTNGRTAVNAEALAILEANRGIADPFGQAYHLPAGEAGANRYGNSRPFQTEPVFRRIVGRDYFGAPADNTVYNRGPMMDLINSPSFPSGHTTYGYTGALMLALFVPERYPEMVARGAEYGNHRIVVGAHYAMDVLGGRVVALYTMAHLLANDPDFLNQSFSNVPPVKDFRAALLGARKEVRAVLEAGCGKAIAECAREDTGRLSDPAANEALYASTQTYGLPVAFPEAAGKQLKVSEVAPEAGYLLTVAFPALSLDEANDILTRTLGPGGGFLDDGGPYGVYSRINLYAASQMAMRLAAGR